MERGGLAGSKAVLGLIRALTGNVNGLAKKRWGKRFREVSAGSGDPGIRGTPSSGSRLFYSDD
jgi:hypothetical protein